VVLLLKFIPIENFITRFLGKFYLEIYAIHGFVLMLYHSKFICIDNPVIYSLAVLATTIPLAWVISPIFKKILQLGKGTATKV
jgi:peptidoglycan/LPS O-acetylase OafA/YrhL